MSCQKGRLVALALALMPMACAAAQAGESLAYVGPAVRDDCSSLGFQPTTMVYKQCVANEVRNGTPGVHLFGREADGRQLVVVDDYGFQYGRDGRLYDPEGREIRYVPR